MRCACAVALILAAGCSGAHRAAANAGGTPAPLGSCETRIMDLDGAQIAVSSNIDNSLASVTVINASDAASRAKAVDDAIHYFGPVKRDTRITTHQSRWIGSTLTDPCGRPVAPPSPRPGVQ